ncbi:MAG: GntR family transcriptional regulator [Gemmatimonadetes bacterium]|nr:GntR family transcriptional regulator [Gemmatimonadota bacterium]
MPRTPWPQVTLVTLADQAHAAIRARILGGEMPPGEFVREQDVSEALGVSRTPVREALGRLASEGFLERIPHRGFRVPDEPVGTLLALYPIVSALDLLAGRLALPRLTPEDVAELRDINRRLALGADDPPLRIELNNAFHRLISERSGNQRLTEMLDDLRSQLTRLEIWYYSHEGRTQESVADHEAVLQALEANDHEKALGILESDMALTLQRLSE